MFWDNLRRWDVEVTRRWSEATKEWMRFCVPCLVLGYVLLGIFNAPQRGALAVHGGLIIFVAPLMLKRQYSIHRKKREVAEQDEGRSRGVDWGSPCVVFAEFVLLAILNIPVLGYFYSLKVRDANSMGALFVGVQWCIIYLVRGVVIEDVLNHLKRLVRVASTLVGFLIGAIGLPWGFPLVVVLSELFLGLLNEVSVENRDSSGCGR